MNFTLSIILFFVVLVLYVQVIDVFTFMMRLTGMTEEKARFQVISLLTNSGYTTNESEIVVRSLSRRKLARTIMMFGYVFSVTIVSAFINIMFSLEGTQARTVWPVILLLCGLYAALFVVRRIPAVKAFFNARMEAIVKKRLFKGSKNVMVMLDEFPRGVIARIRINKMPKALEGKTFGELNLYEHGVRVVMMEEKKGSMVEVSGDTKFQEGDSLVVFGRRREITKLFAASTK